ncbi:MAG: HEPN domain-containing protein, partial [Holophagales bacterium]|nr:HEPN domain-containing protein [Holophagales bacterium]
MNVNIGYWLDLADYDFETEKAMLSTGRYLYVGFMCHQTIEKALKAIISRGCEEGNIPPKTHHLLKLADRAGLFNKMPAKLQTVLKTLNPLHIEARYPE